MFGAHLNDLPQIWKELIEAGFESGHAYGKALAHRKKLCRLYLVPFWFARQRELRDKN
jgi:NAD(P)H-nitrite reductase large subunit